MPGLIDERKLFSPAVIRRTLTGPKTGPPTYLFQIWPTMSVTSYKSRGKRLAAREVGTGTPACPRMSSHCLTRKSSCSSDIK
jgi:hypothetical protein